MSRARRKGSISTVDFSPVGGVHFGISPIDLGTTELSRSMNGYYPRQTMRWTTRQPLSAMTSDLNSLADPILSLYNYYNGTTQYLICASGGKLHYMTRATLDGTPAWTEIGSLTDSVTKPTFVTWNGYLLIADGGTAIRHWNGTTYGTLTNGPSGTTAIIEARNRLVANSSEADAVYFSTAEFTGTDFDDGGGSIVLKAGFGDGLNVNALAIAPGGNAIVVSKANSDLGEQQLRLIDISSSTSSSWYVSNPFVNKEGAQNAHGILSSSNSVFFFDETGIKKVEPTDQYGDLQSSPIFGDRINRVFEDFSAVANEIKWLPTYTAFMLILVGHPQQYLYFPRNNAWCPWRFADLIINSVETIDDEIYVAGNNGILYKLDGSKSSATDEVNKGGDEIDIDSFGRTKRVVNMGYDIKLRRTTLYITPMMNGSIELYTIGSDGTTELPIGSCANQATPTLLGEADGLLGEADDLLGDSGAVAVAKTFWGGARDNGLQIEWRGLGSGYELNYISTEFEGPLGG